MRVRPDGRIALVVPARDEARLLPRVLASVPRSVWKVVVVDDDSRDATWQVLGRWRDPRVVKLRTVRRLGVGGAILCGYREALALGADAAVVVAGDGQMDFGDLPRVIEPLARGRADYVQGVRFVGHHPRGPMPPTRVIGNRLLSACTSWASGMPVRDSQCGYTAAGVPFLRHLLGIHLPHGYGFPAYVRLAAHDAGFRVHEVTVRALYGSEVSGIVAWRDPAVIAGRILRHGVTRRVARFQAGVRASLTPVATRRADGAA
jgi:glycosyltransferase involved in cell wall biosynthesis